MKIAVIFIFLTIARVKEKEACTKRPNRGESSNRLTQHIELDDRGSHPPLSKLPWTSPLAKALQAEPYEIKETKHNWWKDHQILVPTDGSEEFPPLTQRAEILGLRTTWNVAELVNRDAECKEVINFKKYHYKKEKSDLDTNNAWHMFFATITNCHMYPEDSDAVIQNLLGNMSTLQVDSVENFGDGIADGTQIKLKLTFENGMKAVFKPMRFDHNYETDPNEFFFNEMERPNAEIAAFHLDKLLGFRRGVPTIGREFRIKEDIIQHTSEEFRKVIKYYESPSTNWCVIGSCRQYCDTAHAICAVDGKIRGSVQVWLPDQLHIGFTTSPYKRIHNVNDKESWQANNWDYCENDVKHRKEFRKGRRLLDLVDLSIFDFLTGNQDRHGYEWFSDLDLTKDTEGAFVIPLDSGRAFGSPHFDDLDILAPLTQCCTVRPSTVKSLLDFYEAPVSLGKKLEETLKKRNDPLRPILARKYLIAIDRRVEIVLQAVVDCLTNAADTSKVLVNKFKPSRRRRPFARWKRLTGLRTYGMEEHDVMTRQKRNTEEVSRPEIDEDLVDALNIALKPFLEMLDPCPDEKKLNEILSAKWYEFYAEMSNCHLYKTVSKVVEKVLKKMNESGIQKVYGKTMEQFQAILVFANGDEAVFKPMRFGREYETNPNHFYFEDFDRHHAEIAAFHLDRLLAFRRVPPTIGRWLNITDFVNKQDAERFTHFSSPAGNDCFYGGCRRYCTTQHAFCGSGGFIQGSVRLTFDPLEKAPESSPYAKTYSEQDYNITSNRTEKTYCDQLKRTEPYDKGRLLLDLVDLHIFDFLTGNQERDTYQLLGRPYNKRSDPYIFVVENGKAFGNPRDDDLTILAPLTQCCIVRPSTVKMLLDFYKADDSLGEQLDASLKVDPLYPILAEKYLSAVNRRVEIVLQQVEMCLNKPETAPRTEAYKQCFEYSMTLDWNTLPFEVVSGPYFEFRQSIS